MNPIQAIDDKHLIFDDQFEGELDADRPLLHPEQYRDFWGSRYLCIQAIHNEELWYFDIFDLLTNESKQFQNVMTHFLNYEFMLIVEMTVRLHGVRLYRVNLIKLNWESGVFETLEHFERHFFSLRVIEDSLNQSKFVLRFSVFDDDSVIEYQGCKLVNGKIKLGNIHRLPDGYSHCSDGKLIGIYNLDWKFRIKTYNMVDKKEQTFETELCPEHVELVVNSLRKWIVDRLYVAIRFPDSGNYGFMCTNAEIRHWNILNFSTTAEIKRLHFFYDTLIVTTQQAEIENKTVKSNVKFYGIAIHRPQSLRQKARLTVTRNLKRKCNSDPYKEAARFLPFNSDLRPHWFEDAEDKVELDQGKDDDKSNSGGITGESKTIQFENKDVEDEAPNKQDNDVGE